MNSEAPGGRNGGQSGSQQPARNGQSSFDMSKISKGSKLIFAGSIVTLIAMFLPWFGSRGTEIFGQVVGRYSINGFHSAGYLVFLAALVALIISILPAMSRKMPKMGSLKTPTLQLILGGAVILFSLITVLWLGSSSVGLLGIGVGVGVKYGGFVAIVGGVIMLIGAWVDRKKAEQEKMNGEKTPGDWESEPEGNNQASGGASASGGEVESDRSV